ncbi:MAG: 30S ribosomal protein S7 [Patescibacteria group bacterium]
MRRKRNTKRDTMPDPAHDSILVAKITNYLMYDGKKNTAERVMHDMFDVLQKARKDEEPLQVLETAIKNISPAVEIRPRRVGGATYQVPREINPDRKLALAIRWLVGAARGKKGKPMANRLADEILLALKNEGSAIKKKQDTHRMAEANRAFAHFAW